MKVIGIEGMTADQIASEIRRGGVFVVYQYCVSLLFYTSVNPSRVHFIKSGRNRWIGGLPSTLISLLLGWWGFPWGLCAPSRPSSPISAEARM